MFYLAASVLILTLRLVIWKFFPTLESGLKDDLSNMIVASCVFAMAVLFFTDKAVRRDTFARSGLEGPLALFIAAAAVSLGWTVDKWLSIKALIMLAAYVLYFFILLDTIRREPHRRIFLWAFFMAAIAVAVVGINDIIVLSRISPAEVENARLTNRSLYYILIHKRACSFFGWPNVLAGFLMLAMPLAGALFMMAKSWAVRVFVVLGFLTFVTAFFFTYSFLGWAGFLFVSAGMFIALVRTGHIMMSPKLARCAMVLLAVAGVLFMAVILKKDFSGAISPRKAYVGVVCSTIAEYPLWGGGFGAYFPASSKYVKDLNSLTAFAHNTYAQVWAETGLPGFAAILWLTGLSVWMAFRRWRDLDKVREKWLIIAAVWGLGAYFFDNLNSFTMLKPNSSFFFWVWLAVFCSLTGREGSFSFTDLKVRRAVMVFLAVASAGFLFLSVRAAASLSALREGKDLAAAGKFEPALKAMQRAQAMNPLDAASLTVQGDLYLKVFQATKQVQWLDRAQESLMKAAAWSPHAYYNHLALSSIYNLRGSRIMAQEELTRASYLSPYETGRDIEAMNMTRRK